MLSRRYLASATVLLLAAAPSLLAQNERHGRKYKAPPQTSHLEVLVVKGSNGKVIENAGVIFHPTREGVDEGNLEVKSGPDGKAFIDIIPQGSNVEVQVIADGFVTYAGHITLSEPSVQLTVHMLRPKEQVSAYEASEGRNGGLDRKAGVQEPVRNKPVSSNDIKPLPADAPVIKLPSLPQNKSSDGDPTVHAGSSGNGTEEPMKSGASSSPIADGGSTSPASSK